MPGIEHQHRPQDLPAIGEPDEIGLGTVRFRSNHRQPEAHRLLDGQAACAGENEEIGCPELFLSYILNVNMYVVALISSTRLFVPEP